MTQEVARQAPAVAGPAWRPEDERVSALVAAARMEGQMLTILELQGYTALEHLVHRSLQRVAARHPSLLEREGWVR